MRDEDFRDLDEAIEEAAGTAAWDELTPPSARYVREAFVHPEGGGSYDEITCPEGSRVSIVREWPIGPGAARMWLMPVGPRAESVVTVVWAGTAADVQEKYAECLSRLAADGWHIQGAPALDGPSSGRASPSVVHGRPGAAGGRVVAP